MRTAYLTPALLILLLTAAVGWFVMKPSAEPSPHVAAANATPQATQAPRSGAAGGGPLRSGKSPFLTTHEQGTVFMPDGENLAPSFHVELEALRRGLEEAPQDTTRLIRMARLLQDGHKTEEAVTYYRQYLALHPDGRQAWLDLARCYGVLERWDEALATTRDMLGRFADDPAALYNLGAIYANTGRFGEARETWKRVARQERDPAMQVKAEGALQRLDSIHP